MNFFNPRGLLGSKTSYPLRSYSPFLLTVVISLLTPLPVLAQFNPVERASATGANFDLNDASSASAIISDNGGRYIVFQSDASDFVTGDINDVTDIFIRDRELQTNARISLTEFGNEANGASTNPDISSDAQFVVFESVADNLVAGDINGVKDIFVRDTNNSTTERVSLTEFGGEANGASSNPVISADGNFVAFQSDATNLVAGDTNGTTDVFIRDLVNDTTTRVSVTSLENQVDGTSTNPSISQDGQFVAFQSDAENLVSGDTNQAIDVFLRDITGGNTSRVSLTSAGNDGAGDSTLPSLSADGTLVAFQSDAPDLTISDDNGVTDVFLHNTADGTTVILSADLGGGDTNGASTHPAISAAGRYIAFRSEATNIILNDDNGVADVYVVDRTTNTSSRVSVRESGVEVDGMSSEPAINGNANFVAYTSVATDVVNGDSNDVSDVFVVNTQCLVTPEGVTPLDSDGDGTHDCNDACGADPNKIVAGVCGCGVAETDTDADTTPDCSDSCPSDASKIEAGECGCGLADTDADGNEVADCLDPTAQTKPRKVRILRGDRGTGRVRIAMPDDFRKVRYEITVRIGKKTFRKLRGRRQLFKLRGLTPGVRYNVRYAISVPTGGSTLTSGRKSFVAR